MSATTRYAVTTVIFVEATAEDEAALIVERDLAGRFDNELVSVEPARPQS